MINASQLMIKLYEEEEKRLGVQYDLNGILTDKIRPLAPKKGGLMSTKY